eukprot:1083821-Amphidinium_carterae.1
MDGTLRSRYDCKSGDVLGPDPEDDTEVTIRYVRGSHPRVEIEHDVRHLDYLMRDLGLDGMKVKALDCPSSQSRHARDPAKNRRTCLRRASRVHQVQVRSDEDSLPLIRQAGCSEVSLMTHAEANAVQPSGLKEGL